MPQIELNISELIRERQELADFLAGPSAFSDPGFSSKNRRFTELEALIATAVGLVAAIPAVIAYNHFQHKIRVLIKEMDSFSTEFLNIVQRTISSK